MGYLVEMVVALAAGTAWSLLAPGLGGELNEGTKIARIGALKIVRWRAGIGDHEKLPAGPAAWKHPPYALETIERFANLNRHV